VRQMTWLWTVNCELWTKNAPGFLLLLKHFWHLSFGLAVLYWPRSRLCSCPLNCCKLILHLLKNSQSPFARIPAPALPQVEPTLPSRMGVLQGLRRTSSNCITCDRCAAFSRTRILRIHTEENTFRDLNMICE